MKKYGKIEKSVNQKSIIMKPGKTLKVCGSIIKKESLVSLKNKSLEHTHIAEANLPYANYYGRMPSKPTPNSLFLFTDRYYTLEEALWFTQNIEICEENKVDVASACLQFSTRRYPAIRLRDFPDYDHLKMLQECYIKEGMKFARKVSIEPEALVTVNKCFVLTEKEEGIYLDQTEKNEGYIVVPRRLNTEDFESLMHTVWNNGECRIFDAARGGFIIDAHVKNIVRVFSEHLDISLLKCAKKALLKHMQ